MCESPQSLQDVCIDFICDNIHILCNKAGSKNVFNSSDVYLPSNVSEHLLEALGGKVKLSDETLLLFDEKLTCLQRVKIKNASRITSNGLSILRKHKIYHLEVKNLSAMSVNELIGCLGEWTLNNLQSLDVSHCGFGCRNRIFVMVALSKLKNLSSLNLSCTDFNLRGLDIVTQDLPLLENLDISNTIVREITPLKRCKDRLRFLNTYNLKIINSDDFMSVLYQLNNLCHLDISDDRDDPFSAATRSTSKVPEFLRSENFLRNLVSLDISGNEGITCRDLRKFLLLHPGLRFLGLMLTDACSYDMFTKEVDAFFNPELTISGCGTLNQIIDSLQRYLPRKTYIQKSLYCLYSHIQKLQEVRLDIIMLVLEAMSSHPKMLGLQLAATACVYNLTKSSLGVSMHPHWLKKAINLTLDAMRNFPKHQQLQKNALLTLCSDRVLQDVSFDRYKCAELVMESLIQFDEPSMNRMSVAICSILAAKISTTETSTLGTKSVYMERLLDIVRIKTEDVELDIMMKFTLSALWNLTDESPATCAVFLSMDGLVLFLKVLEKFPGEGAIETKVLGLLNNIAEVSHLRPHLMKNEFLVTLRSLLHSSHVDVSYFAAGIIAHLASDQSTAWTCTIIPKQEILDQLRHVVQKWDIPETEMVAYRSFSPFLPLLKCYDIYEVQLWAVWAIHHVCSKNPKRYTPMLTEENGVLLIQRLLEHHRTDSLVVSICYKILKIVNRPIL